MLAWVSHIQLVWPDSEPQTSSCIWLPSTGAETHNIVPSLLPWDLSIILLLVQLGCHQLSCLPSLQGLCHSYWWQNIHTLTMQGGAQAQGARPEQESSGFFVLRGAYIRSGDFPGCCALIEFVNSHKTGRDPARL